MLEYASLPEAVFSVHTALAFEEEISLRFSMTELNRPTSNMASTLTTPAFERDLPASLRSKYEDLVKEISMFETGPTDPSDAAYEVLCERVVRTVTDHPVLATVVSNEVDHRSLLKTLCSMILSPLVLPAIKFLIQQNPSALLWKSYPSQNGTSLIRDIANRDTYYDLLIWIAQHYSWVLDHPDTRKDPPHFTLLQNYLSDTSCTADTVRDFFHHYPQGLSQEEKFGNGLALHRCCSGREGTCDPELFRWMAEQYPPSMLHADMHGYTPLHHSCIIFISDDENSDLDNNMREICRFLIATCPDAARMKDDRDQLPIQWCARSVYRRVCQDVAMMLLRAYPESIDVVGKQSSASLTPYSVSFLQRISPLLIEEKSLQSEIADLTQGLMCLKEAANVSRSSVLNFASAYEEWVALRKVEAQSRLDNIPSELEKVCCSLVRRE